jgi:hypothetical protein
MDLELRGPAFGGNILERAASLEAASGPSIARRLIFSQDSMRPPA